MTCCSSSVVLVIVVHLWNNLPEDVGTANLFALRISIIEILQGKQITGGVRLLVHLHVNLAFCLALLIDMLSQSSKLRSCVQLQCDFGSVIL